MNSVYNLHIALSLAHKIFYQAMEIAALLPKQAFNKPLSWQWRSITYNRCRVEILPSNS